MNFKIEIIDEFQANEFVKVALEFIRNRKILEIKRFSISNHQGDNPFDYQAIYELRYKDELKKVIIPFSMDSYYDLLRQGLGVKWL